MGIAFIPLYIKYLGVEAYGLIGVFATLQALFVVLDAGLGQSLNREMARFLGGSYPIHGIRNLLRSMEVIYLAVSVVIGLVVVSVSGWLAVSWFKVEDLPNATVADAISIMGGVIALRWIGGLYRSALMGLQEQVWVSVINLLFSTLRGLGVVAILVWVDSTIQAFFYFQGLLSLIETAMLWGVLYKVLPKTEAATKFGWAELRQVWHFAGGVALITLLVILMTQMDKILLSNRLPLDEFGYYTLAGVVASALYMLINPIGSATAPRLAELVARNDTDYIRSTYHRYAQLMSMTLIPAAFVLFAFSDHLLMLWTGSIETTSAAAPIVSALCIGTMLNGLMYIPYTLQLAYGWTRLTIWLSLVTLALLVPSLLWAVHFYGAVGAAWMWAGINFIFILVALPIMHRRLMPGELKNWYLRDVLPTLVVSGLVSSAISELSAPPSIGGFSYSVMVVLLASVATLSLAIAATPLGRELIKSLMNKVSGGRST